MSNTERVAVSRVVRADPSQIFHIVTDPKMHVEIDGSGMLEAAPNAKRLEAAGDTFDIDMDREPLGDLPLGKYKVRNSVTQITPGALIEWSVGGTDGSPPLGYVYGWEITPLGNDETKVTNYCDWSKLDRRLLPEALREKITFPVVPVTMMERSVENLARLAAAAAEQTG